MIDYSILNLLYSGLGFHLIAAATCAFLVAVCNGFYWNRRWTFKAGHGSVLRQYPKFVTTNVIGLGLNLSIMTLALIIASHLHLTDVRASAGEILRIVIGQGEDAFSPLAVNAAKAVATVAVTAWNFTASKLWTFRA